MSEEQTPPPAWWSTPAPSTPPTTADTNALNPEELQRDELRHDREPMAPAPGPRRRVGRTNPALLALALLASGAVGGGVVAAFDNPGTSPTAAISTTSGSGSATVSRTTNGSSVPSSTSGTPESAAATIAPSVVTIEVTGTKATGSGAFGGRSQSVSGTGSGIVLDDAGHILTNNHVVAVALNGGSVHVTLPNGKTVPATIVGHATTDDLAVIKVADATGLTAATFADSTTLKVGQDVLAVGAPLGLSNTVTLGIVSTLNRPVRTGEPGAPAQSVIDAIQTDAAINPGNSGGALVDLAGHVVGVNSAIATTGSSGGGQSGNIGVGFAIPANDAVRIAQELISTGHANHAQIGLSVADAASTTSGAPGLGATIGQVVAGGPGATAGLRAGDLVTSVEGRRVTDADSLIVAVRDHEPGSTVSVTYLRNGGANTARVKLASATSD